MICMVCNRRGSQRFVAVVVTSQQGRRYVRGYRCENVAACGRRIQCGPLRTASHGFRQETI